MPMGSSFSLLDGPARIVPPLHQAARGLRTDMTQRLSFRPVIGRGKRCRRELTMRAVAKACGISERTMFRYFASRDDFLDALAAELVRTLALPPHPRTIDELLAMPPTLYRSFEEKHNLMRASLKSELS